MSCAAIRQKSYSPALQPLQLQGFLTSAPTHMMGFYTQNHVNYDSHEFYHNFVENSTKTTSIFFFSFYLSLHLSKHWKYYPKSLWFLDVA